MDVERVVAKALMESTGFKTFVEVPIERPDEFITVELTGTGGNRFARSCFFAIQSWAQTRKDAEALSELVEDAIYDLDEHPNLFNPMATGTYRFPDPDSNQSRYQTNLELMLCE